MRSLPYFEDPDTREDILDHISGYVFDRATLSANDEPMRRPMLAREREFEQECRARRSVRR
jgi:hypothetical protein